MSMLTVDDVKREVERIRGAVGDYEIAHSLEDQLREKVLQAIAVGNCQDPKQCAAVALETRDFDFVRYCA